LRSASVVEDVGVRDDRGRMYVCTYVHGPSPICNFLKAPFVKDAQQVINYGTGTGSRTHTPIQVPSRPCQDNVANSLKDSDETAGF